MLEASPRGLLAGMDKLDAIRATGAMDVDLTWVRGALRKSLDHRVRQSSVHRLRELLPGHRYAAVPCFLQVYRKRYGEEVPIRPKRRLG